MAEAQAEQTPETEGWVADSGLHRVNVQTSFDRLKAASRREAVPSYEARMARLDRLLAAVRARQDEIATAISRDFGNRAAQESKFAEVYVTVSAIHYTKKHLKKWMQPERRSVPVPLLPGKARVLHQPLGVVGIISPWNYPFVLAVTPLIAALAAGNRVLIKPSEYTPNTSALLRRLCADVFESDVVDVVLGGPEVGEAFSRLPFDHLLFTGSTTVGKLVMRAAAENLTPVTLELGGKSPTIIHESYPVDRAALRIAYTKCFNAGQTCIAPDYLLVHESKVGATVEELRASATRLYPSLRENRDYTSIQSQRHHDRLRRLLQDAVDKGARKVVVNPEGETNLEASRKMPLTILWNVSDDMAVMQEEIFGPILPIVSYRTLDDAIDYVEDRPRPLALYIFDEDEERVRRVLERTLSGGAAVNDVMLHFAVEDMPFGGVGPSGVGAYHGFEGFQTFSHRRGVFYQHKWNTANLLLPPYGERIEKLLKRLIG